MQKVHPHGNFKEGMYKVQWSDEQLHVAHTSVQWSDERLQAVSKSLRDFSISGENFSCDNLAEDHYWKGFSNYVEYNNGNNFAAKISQHVYHPNKEGMGKVFGRTCALVFGFLAGDWPSGDGQIPHCKILEKLKLWWCPTLSSTTNRFLTGYMQKFMGIKNKGQCLIHHSIDISPRDSELMSFRHRLGLVHISTIEEEVIFNVKDKNFVSTQMHIRGLCNFNHSSHNHCLYCNFVGASMRSIRRHLLYKAMIHDNFVGTLNEITNVVINGSNVASVIRNLKSTGSTGIMEDLLDNASKGNNTAVWGQATANEVINGMEAHLAGSAVAQSSTPIEVVVDDEDDSPLVEPKQKMPRRGQWLKPIWQGTRRHLICMACQQCTTRVRKSGLRNGTNGWGLGCDGENLHKNCQDAAGLCKFCKVYAFGEEDDVCALSALTQNPYACSSLALRGFVQPFFYRGGLHVDPTTIIPVHMGDDGFLQQTNMSKYRMPIEHFRSEKEMWTSYDNYLNENKNNIEMLVQTRNTQTGPVIKSI